MRKAKYLSNQSIATICKTFDIKPNKAAARRAARKDGDANEWIPTEAVKKIKEIQNTFDSKMTETCIS
jgi:chlorite dismutase